MKRPALGYAETPTSGRGRQKLRNQTAVKARAVEIQESLKILQFRYRRKVGFRPVVVRRGVRYYPVKGKQRSE